ncbi:MAG: sodium:proton antiporter NhaD [Bacteroidales bacterium]
MIAAMVIVFLFGYILIALEQKVKINKSAIALVMGMTLWVLYAFDASVIIPQLSEQAFQFFLKLNPSYAHESYHEQVFDFVAERQIVKFIGETAEILFFLISAMTIVELIDVHGGFAVITNRIKAKEKKKLLWLITFVTFFLSAVLDNMTTAIVIIMMLRKLVHNKEDKWLFIGMVIIAANAGGAWSPVGDITTILLWVKGNVSTALLLKQVLLPSIVSIVVPGIFIARKLKGNIEEEPGVESNEEEPYLSLVSKKERISILAIGVIGILLVPVFKSVTHLPPVIGILMSLGYIWVYTEIMYAKKPFLEESQKMRVGNVIKRIDTATILYFMGILMSVGALQVSGILGMMSEFLDKHVHNVYLIDLAIGFISSVVDNGSLVAGAIGMYPLANIADLAGDPNFEYMKHFVADGNFWQFLSYCAGTGGSMLIIGSAAGVVAMGLEKITFSWYLKHITLYAFIGFLMGAATFMLLISL